MNGTRKGKLCRAMEVCFFCFNLRRSLKDMIMSLGGNGLVVVDVTTLKMARKPVKLQKENPAGCDGEGKHNKGN